MDRSRRAWTQVDLVDHRYVYGCGRLHYRAAPETATADISDHGAPAGAADQEALGNQMGIRFDHDAP